tara:strand:- start:64 stop:891 length:828 start_codon:yes stop_codon:yes gene_type:complete
MKLIHLSDTHFVPDGKKLYGHDPKARLQIAIEDINRNHSDAELVVITGDLTHWGEPDAFSSLASTLDHLKPPVQLLIGNHDERDVFRTYFKNQKHCGDGFVQSTRNVSAGHFIFLDTVLKGSHAGHLCETRLKWLTDALGDAVGNDIFIFMHHPPCDLGLKATDKIGLQQKEAFKSVITPYLDRLRHLFFGHVHRPVAGSWLGIPISSVRAINHQIWFDLESEDIVGSFEPPSYCVVLIDNDRVVVHYHDFMDASPKFPSGNSPWNDWATRFPHP